MKKVGICTLYYNNQNYGANLQSYALAKIVSSLGYEAEMVSCYDHLRTRLLLSKMKRAITAKPALARNLHARKTAVDNFSHAIPHSKLFFSYSIPQANRDYDAFITGSDQVWNPDWINSYMSLDFVAPSKLTIAYAASVGKVHLNSAQQQLLKKALDNTEYVSIREKESIPALQELTDKQIEHALDPTLLLKREEWEAVCSERLIPEDYLFCYFLGGNATLRKTASAYARQRGLKIVTLPFLNDAYREVDDGFGDYPLYDVSPEDFLSLIRYASFVLTDSFHGAVFSHLFEREFVVSSIAHDEMGCRLETLTALFGTQARYVPDHDLVTPALLTALEKEPLAFNRNNYEHMRQKSLEFLQRALSPLHEICEHDICTGCAACASSCPKHCIEMRPDAEGFLRPVIDPAQCVDCGKCRKVCPVNHPYPDDGIEPQTFAARNQDEHIREQSSSGGVFSALATRVLKNNGVVIAAGFDKDHRIVHKCCTQPAALEELRGSKYVQSQIGTVYREAKAFLESGKEVLFCGTPCQVGGLKAYLGKDYPQLLSVDFICHGVPSPYAWERYLAWQRETHHSEIKHVSFRNKQLGWQKYSMRIDFENGACYSMPESDDAYLSCFIRDVALRPSCFSCHFKQKHRVSDITLGDFWGLGRFLPEWDDDKGTSLMFVHSDNGHRFLAACNSDLEKRQIAFADAISCNPSAISSVRRPALRSAFMKNLHRMRFDMLHKKYCSKSFVSIGRRKISKLLHR